MGSCASARFRTSSHSYRARPATLHFKRCHPAQFCQRQTERRILWETSWTAAATGTPSSKTGTRSTPSICIQPDIPARWLFPMTMWTNAATVSAPTAAARMRFAGPDRRPVLSICIRRAERTWSYCTGNHQGQYVGYGERPVYVTTYQNGILWTATSTTFLYGPPTAATTPRLWAFATVSRLATHPRRPIPVAMSSGITTRATPSCGWGLPPALSI